MSENDVLSRLLAFIGDKLWPDGMAEELDADTRLLELGVLDSLKFAMLLNFISCDLEVRVPALMIEFRNFKDVRSVAAMVSSLMAGPAMQR
jgi:acyl carrier protein